MRVLCVNSVVSDKGGVEFAAMNLARGLAERGHEVHFLGSASAELEQFAGIARHYRKFPRAYPLGEKHGALQKLIWHAQDLAHPANEALFSEVLQEVRPEALILHNLTAVGLNIWRPIKASGVPCIQVIHDLSLICFQIARFRNGRQCSGLCLPCRAQKTFRFSLIRGAGNFAFVSPSRATLSEIERYADLSAWRREVISNPNTFLVKPRAQSVDARPRLLYVGRLDSSKGVEMMLRSAALARQSVDFDFDILGSGPLETTLRQRYADAGWARFHGNVSQDSVAEFMSRATVLLVPSLWLETVPGVAVHALFAGLPVLGARIGGIPEHVFDGRTGRLLPPGDEQAWGAEIVRVLKNPAEVAAWRAACPEAARAFDPQRAIDAYERLMLAMQRGSPG